MAFSFPTIVSTYLPTFCGSLRPPQSFDANRGRCFLNHSSLIMQSGGRIWPPLCYAIVLDIVHKKRNTGSKPLGKTKRDCYQINKPAIAAIIAIAAAMVPTVAIFFSSDS